jgi:hypothetical protein
MLIIFYTIDKQDNVMFLLFLIKVIESKMSEYKVNSIQF